MLLAAWFFWKREKSGLTFRERFRLQSFNGKALIWTILLTLTWIATSILVQPVTEWVQANWFPPNKLWIRLMAPDPNYFMEIATSEKLLIYPAIAAFILLNVFGGELFFRGYIFPRQELAFGKFTWLYHALFWTFFRSFLPWELPVVIVVAIAVSLVVQITRNTWTSIIAHAIALSAAFVRMM
jgi:membrane protease YdiL (CAAX protease family)